MREQDNAINRVLRAWGMGSIDEPGTVAQLAYMVDDHHHLTTLLRACEPGLRRQMYEAMRPHLQFPAKPYEHYEIAAKDDAAAHQWPVLDEAGNLKPYMMPNVVVPEVEVHVTCRKCGKECFFLGDRMADAIQQVRHTGWAWNELDQSSVCPECLDNGDIETATG